jgi:tetratricopeptide (TPR) repeat protein
MCSRMALIMIGVLLAAQGAQAQSPNAAAKRRFKTGQMEYKLGRFDKALDEFSAAYEARPLAAFLFNIGQCHRQLGHFERAIFFFEGYLRDKPNAKNRTTVEELLAESRQQLAAEEERLEAERRAAAEAQEREAREQEAREREADEQREREAAARLAGPAPGTAEGQSAGGGPLAIAGPGRTPNPAPLGAGVLAQGPLSPGSLPQPEMAAPIYQRTWFWAVIGGVVAATAGGAYFIVRGRADNSLPSGSLGTLDRR